MQRPLTLWPLVFFLLVLSFGGGFYGGIAMLADPTGNSLGVADALPDLPVEDFVLPGLFLLIVMGIYPLVLAIALVFKPTLGWLDSLFCWSKHYWAWSATLILVAILAVWLIYESILIGMFPITYITAILGALILLFALMPGVRKYYTT